MINWRAIGLIFTLFTTVLLSAQQKGVLSGVVVDSNTKEALFAAQLVLSNKSDTLYTTSDKTGKYNFEYPINEKSKTMSLKVYYMGYKDYEKVLAQSASKQFLSVKLQQDTATLAAAKIVDNIQIITIKGDTLSYNARGIKSMEDETLGDLLQKLPGVEAEGGNVKVNNQEIDFILFNNIPVFGTKQSDALREVYAKEVTDIDIYSDSLRRDKRKINVMNVLTYIKFDKRAIMSGFASAGTNPDFQFNESPSIRHNAYGTISYYSPTKNYVISAISNNYNLINNAGTYISLIGAKQNAGLITNRNFNLQYTNGQQFNDESLSLKRHYDLAYRYTGKNTLLNTQQSKEYFDTEQWSDRSQSSKQSSLSEIHNHDFNIEFYNNFGSSYIQARTNAQIGNDYNGLISENHSKIENNSLFDSELTKRNDGSSKSISGEITYETEINENNSLRLFSTYSTSSNNAKASSIDTLASSTSRTYINDNSQGYNDSASASASWTYQIDKFCFGVQYALLYTHNSLKRLAIDNIAQVVDLQMSARHSRNYLTHSPQLNFKYQIDYENQFDIRLKYNNSKLNSIEQYPELTTQAHIFQAFLPEIYLTHRSSRFAYSISLNSYQDIPSIEMLRATINSSNPYFLTAGNPNLQAPVSYSLKGSFSRLIPKIAIFYETHFDAKLKINNISYRTDYFLEPTILHDYGDYIAAAGSQLSTYCNSGTALELSWRNTFKGKINNPNLFLDVSPSIDFTRTPEYLGPNLNISKKYIFRIGARVKTNFSESFNIRATYSYNYIKTDNSITANNIASNHNLAITSQYEKGRFFVASSFDYSYYNGQIAAPSYGRNSLNAIIGIKLFRQKNAQLSISAYDILNNAPRISTQVNAQGITTIWNTNYQRLISINFYYKFQK